MRLFPRVQYKNAAGLADKFVGLGKELFGEAVDNKRWIESGEAQQAKADAHETKARAHEAKQRTAERAKA